MALRIHVEHNEARTLHVALPSGLLTIGPGRNMIPEPVWREACDHDQVVHRLRTGVLEERDAAPELGRVDWDRTSPRDFRDLLDVTDDFDMLTGWLNAADTPTDAKYMIEHRLQELRDAIARADAGGEPGRAE